MPTKSQTPSARSRRPPLLWVGVLAAGAAIAGGALLLTRTPHGTPVAGAPAGPGVPAAPAAAPGHGILATALRPAAGSLSTIKVVVARNDTLDRIFRHLQLRLSDLASLRALPGIRAHLDRLRPGEALTLTARAGELVGLERRLNVDQTLKVVKDDRGFSANVLENPLQTRTRTIGGRIDSSLFEAVDGAGGHDATALGLADIFAYDVDFVLNIRPGDSFTVTYTEVLQDGRYLQDAALQADFRAKAGPLLASLDPPPGPALVSR